MGTRKRSVPPVRHRPQRRSQVLGRVSPYWVSNRQKLALELDILKEWERVQHHLFTFFPLLPPYQQYPGGEPLRSALPAVSWRRTIEICIDQATAGRACIWWEFLGPARPAERHTLIEIRYNQTCYGMLDLAPDYLISSLFPWIPRSFAYLCALLLTLAEHQAFLQCLLNQLSAPTLCEPLTNRMYDVLFGLALGENEVITAQRLKIELTTVRTHRHRLYQCLDVHSAQEALLRAFTLRLLDWLDIPSAYSCSLIGNR